MSNKAVAVYAKAMKRQREEGPEPPTPPAGKLKKKTGSADTQVRTDVATNEHSFAHSSAVTKVRAQERTKVRRAYNIFADQAVALEELQLARHKGEGRRPELGELVRDALETYIRREKKRFELEGT